MRARYRLLFAGLLGPAAFASAAQTWDATQVRCATRPLQKSVAVAFAFRNTGDTAITIQDIETNCDCLVANADRKTYAQGESGLIVARFAVGERSGAYERSVFVRTDGSAPQRLQVHIEVPEAATVEPRTQEWTVGTTPAELAFDVTIADGLQVTFSEILSSSAGFRARFETIEPGRRYRVFAQPLDTKEAASTAIRLFGKAGSGENLVISAYAYVH